jgi:hypothetical protein
VAENGKRIYETDFKSSQFRDKEIPQHRRITLPNDCCFLEEGGTSNA